MWRVLRIVAIVMALVVAIVIGLGVAFVVLVASPFEPPAGTTTVSDYPRVLKDWSPTGLVDHFPRTLPPSASNVSLAEFPGFLQGSGYFQLRMTLPPQEVEAILTRTKSAAVRRCPTQCTVYIEDPEYWEVPRLAAGNEKEMKFPPDFVVYALETDGEWNHPTGKGIAISPTRSEVVYWADD